MNQFRHLKNLPSPRHLRRQSRWQNSPQTRLVAAAVNEQREIKKRSTRQGVP
jgi:hypothetical protein